MTTSSSESGIRRDIYPCIIFFLVAFFGALAMYNYSFILDMMISLNALMNLAFSVILSICVVNFTRKISVVFLGVVQGFDARVGAVLDGSVSNPYSRPG